MFVLMFFIFFFLNYFGICKILYESIERKCIFDFVDKEIYRMLAVRRDQYKYVVLKVKYIGDIIIVIQYVKVVKVIIGILI